ncbi:MAG: hypothetical protein SPI77_07300 [Corynebacterium sp.]|nr:hypothetical protein [Corynebacterium sp.]
MPTAPSKPIDLSRRRNAASAVVVALVVAAISWYGGWQRRWMSDDGLIVLRTVRNLLAGYGPVFNAGERVETNTSTLWQYLIYLASLVTDARLEIIALYLALGLSVAAMFIGVMGTAHLYQARLVLPVGATIYFALPPARDFFTSGLEWGLAILWLAVAWALLTYWATTRQLTYLLAVWAGLSWLVRPELALYGAVIGLVLVILARSWGARIRIALTGVVLPGAYEVFRMGYYGLLVPHTAVAKSAADSQWATGWEYLWDLAQPYWLYVPVVLALVAAVLLRGVQVWLPAGIMVGCGLIHMLYVVRLGGDFMHGRMLLLPLFAVLLPVFVVPIRHWWDVLIPLLVVVWAVPTITIASAWHFDPDAKEIRIVDERNFWMESTGHSPADPLLTADQFLTGARMNMFEDSAARAQVEPTAALISILLDASDWQSFGWATTPRTLDPNDPVNNYPLSISYINLGWVAMNTPLEVRVVDMIGLAQPIAARGPRLDDGRVGHDKYLPDVYQLADTATEITLMPSYVNPEDVAAARHAFHTRDYVDLFATYKDPLTLKRFLMNMTWALGHGRTLTFTNDLADYRDLPEVPGAEIQHKLTFTPSEKPHVWSTWGDLR